MLIEYGSEVRRWGVFEVKLNGPQEGNPFVEQSVSAVFRRNNAEKHVEGFYDGNGVYRIRFMPSFTGEYEFSVKASFLKNEEKGSFAVSDAEKGNHGPVRVVGKYHFGYEDGTPYYPFGTTCYVWHLQQEELQEQTLKTLRESCFNKIRFCIFPKHYLFNLKDPIAFPYEGKPMDSSLVTPDNFKEFGRDFEKHGNHWDFSRFNPSYFHHIEKCIETLGKIGIEADLIVMHPYDRWGFSTMSKAEDDLYWHYVISRFAAYHNVWWSLANEYDLMEKTPEDWERYAQILCDCDPYCHLRSVHNWKSIYDFTHPWVTHCSIQRTDPYISTELTDAYRERYGKPVVLDEIAYEGNIKENWGNISGQEMTRRCWEAVVRGGYPGHGETYDTKEQVFWWSHGGVLHGESPARIAFLRKIAEETPGGRGLVIKRIGGPGICGVPDLPSAQRNGVQPYYLIYFGFNRPDEVTFHFDEDTTFRIQVIDTWEMKIQEKGTGKGKFSVSLPGKEYMAIRLISRC